MALPGLMQPGLPKAESQGSQGFEALNPGLMERGRGSSPRNAGESCQACSREGPWAGLPVSPSQRPGLAAVKGLSNYRLVSFVELREKMNVVRLIILLLCSSGLTQLLRQCSMLWILKATALVSDLRKRLAFTMCHVLI